MGSPRFRTITVAPNPPGHWASIVYWTEHPVAADAGSAANATVAAAAVRTAMPAATAGGRLSMSRPFPDPMPDGGRRCHQAAKGSRRRRDRQPAWALVKFVLSIDLGTAIDIGQGMLLKRRMRHRRSPSGAVARRWMARLQRYGRPMSPRYGGGLHTDTARFEGARPWPRSSQRCSSPPTVWPR